MESRFKIYQWAKFIGPNKIYCIFATEFKSQKQSTQMEAQSNTKKYWALFFLWFAILIVLLFVYREFFWLALPGTITYFAKAMDLF